MKANLSWNKNAPIVRVIKCDIGAVKKEFSAHFGCDTGSLNQGALVLSGVAAIEFLKFHNLPLGDFDGWVPKNDIRKHRRLPDSHFIGEAKKHRIRSEWKKQANGEYHYVRRHRPHLIPACTAHMSRDQGPFTRGYQLYAYLFTDNSVYVGITCNPTRRHKDHDKRGIVYEKAQSASSQLSILKDHLMPTDAAQAEIDAIEDYRTKGYAVLNRRGGGSTGRIRSKYTYKLILAEANKFKSKKAFTAARSAMMQAVTLRKWNRRLEKDTGWPVRVGPNWTPESCREEAKKFTYLSDWSSAGGGSYIAAHRAGWLKVIKADLFKTPKPVDYKWTQETCHARARAFSSRSEWQYKAGDGSYPAARRKGWLIPITDDVFGPRLSRWSPKFKVQPSSCS